MPCSADHLQGAQRPLLFQAVQDLQYEQVSGGALVGERPKERRDLWVAGQFSLFI